MSPLESAVAIPAEARLGPVRLQVSDLGSSRFWYSEVLGLQVRKGDRSTLGEEEEGDTALPGGSALAVLASEDGTPLVELVEAEGAAPFPREGAPGLYHFALLLPDRGELGRLIAHLHRHGVPFGAADHDVSEAIYLRDPDGHGIEVYTDRPASTWGWRGAEVEMDSRPLDLADLVAAGGGEAWRRAPSGTRMGHVHFHLSSLEAGTSFFRDDLGLAITHSGMPGARFFSWGGYHHHVGTNVWARRSELPASEDARLLGWTIQLPAGEESEAWLRHLIATRPSLHSVDETMRKVFLVDPVGAVLRIAIEDRELSGERATEMRRDI